MELWRASGNGAVKGISAEREQGLVDEELNSNSNAEFDESKGLMGAPRLPEGVELLSSAQVAFSAVDGDLGDRVEQVGLVADVLQELKLIFSQLERTAGDKRDFFRLLAKVKEEYGPLSGHPSLWAINQFIAEHAGFHLTPDEIDNLWY